MLGQPCEFYLPRSGQFQEFTAWWSKMKQDQHVLLNEPERHELAAPQAAGDSGGGASPGR